MQSKRKRLHAFSTKVCHERYNVIQYVIAKYILLHKTFDISLISLDFQ